MSSKLPNFKSVNIIEHVLFTKCEQQQLNPCGLPSDIILNNFMLRTELSLRPLSYHLNHTSPMKHCFT